MDRIKHTITIERELIKEVKMYAVMNDSSYSDVIEKAVIEYLQRRKEAKKQE